MSEPKGTAARSAALEAQSHNEDDEQCAGAMHHLVTRRERERGGSAAAESRDRPQSSVRFGHSPPGTLQQQNCTGASSKGGAGCWDAGRLSVEQRSDCVAWKQAVKTYSDLCER